MTDSLLLSQIKRLPSNLRLEAAHYIDYLLYQYSARKALSMRPIFGSAQGKYVLSVDFEETLEDFKEYM